MGSKETHIYLATAGSGKTTTLLNIVKEKIKEGTDARRIAFVTFTKVAAQVAIDRVSDMTGIPKSKFPNFGTIHSMCFRASNLTREDVMEAADYKAFGEQAGYKLSFYGSSLTELEDMDWNDVKDNQLVALDSLYRNNRKMVQSHALELQHSGNKLSRFSMQCYNYRKQVGKWDYTDMLENFVSNDIAVDVDYAFIDEAQDMTPLQWKVAMKAFRNCKTVYIAGDPNQAIYEFAGGDPSILVNIRGNVHFLDKSHRVPKPIMALANRIVSLIPVNERADFAGVADNDKSGEVKRIAHLIEVPYDGQHTYMMLAANRKQLKQFTDFCLKQGLPYNRTGVPALTDKEKRQLRAGDVTGIPADKQQYWQRMVAKGTTNWPPININTIHGVKGDEADYVILTPNLQPKTAQQGQSTLNRLFYVAVTRAKYSLNILPIDSPNVYFPLFC